MILNLTDEQQRELVNVVLHLKRETYLYGGLGGNVELVRAAYNGVYDGSPQSYRALSSQAIDAVKRGALQPNPRYVQAFQEAFSGDAAQKSGIGANESLVIEQLVARRLDCTSANVLSLIGELWDQLADNPQYTQQKTANDLRARRIAEMVGDPPTHGFSVQVGPKKFAFDKFGRTYDYQHGMAQGGSLAAKGPWSAGQGGFDSMSDADVENLWNLFRTTQDLKNMSVEDLRKVVKSNGATDIFNKNVHAPDSTPNPTDRLYHPTNGEAFTQKSLIRYINNPNDPYCGRRLITHPSSGKVVPRLKALFEATVRGDFEERP